MCKGTKDFISRLVHPPLVFPNLPPGFPNLARNKKIVCTHNKSWVEILNLSVSKEETRPGGVPHGSGLVLCCSPANILKTIRSSS